MSQTKGIEAAARAIHQMLGITSDAKAGLHPLRRCLGDRQVLDDSWRGWDLNPRPSGYEPDELPDCSTPLILTLAISNARCLPCRIGRVPFSTALDARKRKGVGVSSHFSPAFSAISVSACCSSKCRSQAASTTS